MNYTKSFFTFIVLLLLSTSILSYPDKLCWSSTWDDRKDEESFSIFKSSCSSKNGKRESNGYEVMLIGCGVEGISCCCGTKDWPSTGNDTLLDDEIDLPTKSKELLGEVRLFLYSITSRIQYKSFKETLNNMLLGDVFNSMGTALSGGYLTFLGLDRIKQDFLDPFQRSISKYVGEMNANVIKSISQSKGFNLTGKILEKSAFACGVAFPILKEEINNFKESLNFKHHLSTIVSEWTIAYGIIYTSTEIGTLIGASFFGGGAIPGAVVGFVVGVGIQLVFDGAITYEGKKPADFIRIGWDNFLNIDDQQVRMIK